MMLDKLQGSKNKFMDRDVVIKIDIYFRFNFFCLINAFLYDKYEGIQKRIAFYDLLIERSKIPESVFPNNTVRVAIPLVPYVL
jgi:hypothetical protein